MAVSGLLCHPTVRAADQASAPPSVLAEGAPAAIPARDEKPMPAEIRVKGLGWWKNRQLRDTLQLLAPEDEPLARLDAAYLEDSVVLLQSALIEDGYLEPSGVVEPRLQEQPLGVFPWHSGDVPEIPRTLAADQATFRLEPGVRYAFERLEFNGLTVIDPGDARDYFIEEGFLFGNARSRRFNPSILRRGAANLREQLIRSGYADATVDVQSETRDDRNGHVAVVIVVSEGRLHRVGEVRPPEATPEEVAGALRELCAQAVGKEFSILWQQDFLQGARAVCYRKGYAEAQVKLIAAGAPADRDGALQHDFQLQVDAGPLIHVGEVKFSGDDHTSAGLLRRATLLDPGDRFDQSEIEQDRLHLGALGIYTSVRATVEKSAESVWDVTYQLKPDKHLETSVLLGYGSYERVRTGLEVIHRNLFGQAHRGRLQLVYSQKSISGDYLYTMPQIFGTNTDISARAFGLKREEVSFERKEYGVSLGARRHLNWLGADASVRYQFESLSSDFFDSTVLDPPVSNVASVTLDLTRDHLDNPITPHRGTLLALSLETAARAIGGQVDYQRLDLRGTWHWRVGREKYLHLGLRHGVVWSLGESSAADIPPARRYFPGGEGTVRGYVEGRASPRDAKDVFAGAEVSTIVNLEFERGLARNLAAVVFVDAGFTAAKLGDYPGDQTRVSLGLGLRYNTVIGPARLEYGHNVVSESGDGRDAWHLALGFPF